MRILTRYIIREVSSHSLLGLVIFSFVIYIPHLSSVLEIAARHALSPAGMVLLFLLPIPAIFTLTLPMAVLVGILLGLSRMSADGEVIAARASGIGLAQFVRPVMLYALIGWGLTGWMSLKLAPQAANKLNQIEARLRSSQVPYEIQPRVFIEQFPDRLLYLEDVRGPRSWWHGVFIADSSQRDAPQVTLAESGILVNNLNSSGLTLHLERGATYQVDPQHPTQCNVSSFTDTDIPIPLPAGGGSVSKRLSPPLATNRQLIALLRDPAPGPDRHPDQASAQRRAALVELNYRLALPVAALVLALVGIPIGIYTRKGGKGVGIILAVFLVFLYYILMAFGLSFSKQGRINPTFGLWLANAVFAVAGVLMIARLRQMRWLFQLVQEKSQQVWDRLAGAWRHWRGPRPAGPDSALLRPRHLGTHLLQILDLYIMRSWWFYFALLLVTFAGIYVIFDFFQLLGDIVRNHVDAGVVLNYYRYLIPQVIFLMLPVSVLVATLISFGLLTKTNQITAIKSTGISLYRIAVPVFVTAALLSAGMFVLEDNYLPAMNQQQDAYRNEIKGKPAQTYYRPDRQWIFGQGNRIFNYRFFDPDHNVFANISVFEFDPTRFLMTRRVYASRAFWEEHIHGWVFENGWVRDLDGGRVTNYMPFSVATFKELTEEPPYFKKEVKTSEQMSAFELRGYIQELRQSGFDVVRLSVQFYRKFSFPLIAFVVALIGVPFSFSGGSKGALSGIAMSIGVAIVYWSISSLFEQMGNLHQLPPVIAAWSPDILFGLGGMYLMVRVRT